MKLAKTHSVDDFNRTDDFKLTADVLLGAWVIRRSVSNGFTMTGRAEFSLVEDPVLAFREDGMAMSPAGVQSSFSREYTYVVGAGVFDVYFDAERRRLFQHVVLRSVGGRLVGTGSHDCAPDEYRSSYTFLSARKFVIEHQVEGPRKSYVITTEFSREVQS